jgi:hypothetical protein
MKLFFRIIFLITISFFILTSRVEAMYQPIAGGCRHKGNPGYITALGCIPIDTNPFISWILEFAISIGGGIAFLLMVFASFQLLTSAGDPQKIKEGQELLTSAVAGLMFIIFSVFLLRFIGVDILAIPGFK